MVEAVDYVNPWKAGQICCSELKSLWSINQKFYLVDPEDNSDLLARLNQIQNELRNEKTPNHASIFHNLSRVIMSLLTEEINHI